MPFTIEDVDKHNKDLTDNQKGTWVKVANATLIKCQEAGDTDCDAAAIKQANSVVAKNLTDDELETLLTYKHTQTFNIEGVEIFSTGTWKGDTFTTDDLEHMVKAFDKVGFEPPLKFGHNFEQEKDGQPALGWVGGLRREGDKLLADFKELPQKVYEALKSGRYKQVSSEIYAKFSDEFPFVLRAVALLGADIPAVKGLEAISNLYTDREYKQYDTKQTRKVNKMTDEEIKSLQAKADELEKENKDLSGQVTTLSEDNKSKQTQLEDQKERVKTDKINAFMETAVKAGKVLPASSKQVITLFSSFSDETVLKFSDDDNKTKELSQLDMAVDLFNSFPSLVEFAEKAKADGSDTSKEGDYDSVGDEVDAKANTYMEKNPDVKVYKEAVEAVLAADSDLKARYNA